MDNFNLFFRSGIFLIMYLLIFIGMVKSWRKRAKGKDDILTINTDDITLTHKNKLKILKLSATTNISTFSIKTKLSLLAKADPSLLCIKIHDKFDSKEEIHFGPVEKFEDFLDTIYTFILIWKAKNGFILPKEEIFEKNALFYPEFKNQMEKKYPKEKFEIKEKEELDLPPIKEDHEYYKQVNHVLEPNERIYTYFQRQRPLKKSIKFITFISIILLLFLLLTFVIFIIGITFLVIFAIIWLCAVAKFIKKKRLRFENFWITDKKIIRELAFEFATIPYSDVINVQKYNDKDQKYHLVISVRDDPNKVEKEFVPLRYIGTYFSINDVPNENKLYEIIMQLKKNAQKE